MKTTILNIIKNLSLIAIGTFIFSFGINYFTIANELSEGGVTGIAIILNYKYNLSPSLVILVLNIPLFIFGLIKLGYKSMIYTIIGTLSVTLFLWLTEGFSLPLNDLLLASLFAGLFIGLGLGITFRSGGTTGGSDIIARLVYKSFGISMGRTMLIIDALVITVSAFYIGIERAMYTLVAVYVGSKVIDFVQEGSYAAKAATVITNHASEISTKIMTEMGRGATLLNAKGGYTNEDKEVLYCVIGRSEITRLKKIVRSIDSKAFIVVGDVHDVLGEGFERK